MFRLITHFFIKLRGNENGGILIISLIFMSVLIIFGYSLALLNSTHLKKTGVTKNSLKAHYLAEAGLEQAITEYLSVDENKNWTDNQHLTIFENIQLGRGYYSVLSEEGSNEAIVLLSTGECNGVKKTIKVQLTANWSNEMPDIKFVQWQENNYW